MKIRSCKLEKVGLIFLVWTLFIFQPVLASEDQKVSLAIDQTVFSLIASPGEERDVEINVGNLTDKKQLVLLEFEDISFGEDNQVSLVSGENALFGMKNWISAKEKKWIFEPNETKKITLKISIPKEATVGSHYSGIFFKALPEIQGTNFQDVLVGAQVGSYVLLNISGEVRGEGKINRFEAPTIASKQTDFNVEFENTGNIHYIPHGEIVVKNLLSQKEEKVEVEKHFVFPGKKYTFENNWQGGSVFGVYSAKAYFVGGNSIGHFSRRWIFGKFSFAWLLILAGMIFILGKLRKMNFWQKRKNE